MEIKQIKNAVRRSYARIANRGNPCCTPLSSCCEPSDPTREVSKKIGYAEEDLNSVPEGSNLGLGCGNPVAFASLKEGETVLDLGAGAGFDCFLAANKVGEKGRVIGVDMTPEMVEKARDNAERGGYDNVEFRLGEIESLPVANNSVDVIISNCVINLAPDKRKVFNEAFRTLKPGGRLMISDIVLLKELPAVIKNSIEAYVECVSGAILKDEYIKLIEEAEFQDVRIEKEISFPVESVTHDPATTDVIEKFNVPLEKVEEVVASIRSVKVSAVKPGNQ